MGKIIRKKFRGMSLWAKSALVLTFTLLFMVFMYQGWYKPMHAQASLVTYYLNPQAATNVGTDGTTNMTALASYAVPDGGAANSNRAMLATSGPGGTTRYRAAYDLAGNAAVTANNWEFYRAYTPAYAVNTIISANAYVEFDAYMRNTGTSSSVSVALYDYDPSSGAVIQVGATATKNLTQNNSSLQRFYKTGGSQADFGNSDYVVVAGHRLQMRFSVSMINSNAVLLLWQSSSNAPSGTAKLVVSETAVNDLTISNGSGEPVSTTIGPAVNGSAATPLDSFSLQTNGGASDSVNSLTVSLAAGSSSKIANVMITDTSGSVVYGSASAPASGDDWSVSTPGLVATPTLTDYRVRILPKSFSQMPSPPGGLYPVSATVTAVTRGHLGNIFLNDSGSATITIDNLTPASPSWGSVTAGNGQVSLNWTNPVSEFAGVVVLRNTFTLTDLPVDGRSYVVNDYIGSSIVVYAGSGTSFTDTSTANGTAYFYKIFAFSPYYKYSPGLQVGAFTPSNPNKTTPGNPSAIVASTSSIAITMPYTGDPNGNNSYTVDYKLSASGSWTNWVTNAAHSLNPYATTIGGLTPGASYDVRMTYNDSDGINIEPAANTYTVTSTGITLPVNSTAPASASAIALGFNSINIELPYSNDANNNSTYKIEYRLQGAGSWTTWAANAPHSSSPYVTAISGLTPGAVYDVQVTYLDPDGISGGQPALQQLLSIVLATPPDLTLVHDSTRFIDRSNLNSNPKWSANWGVAGGKYGAFTCNTCHQPSASNIKAIRSSISAPDGSNLPAGAAATIVFRSITSFGNDAGGHATSQRICESCHSQNDYHNYNTSGQAVTTHYNRQDCTACHLHNRGFKASCDICHGDPPINGNSDGTLAGGLAWRAGPSNAVTPTGATNPPSPGAHQKHVVSRGMKCSTCHNGTTMPTVDKQIQIGFAGTPANVPGFKGSVTLGNFSGHTPLSNGYSIASGSSGTSVSSGANYSNSCSVACHGNWNGSGGSVYRPSWVAGSSQAVCGACHGVSAAAAPTRGSHSKHASNAAGKYSFACSTCHPSVSDNSHIHGSVRIALNSSDVRITAAARYNGYLNYSSGAPAPSVSYGSCTSIYCHSTGLNSASPSYVPPTWGNTLNCDGCHGNKSPLAPNTNGSHAKHVVSYECADCHNITVTSGSSAISDVTTHVNKSVDLKLAASRAVGTATYGGINLPQAKTSTGSAGFGSCTNVKCHNDGTGVWTTSYVLKTTPVWGGTGGCDKCHGNATYSDYRKAAPLYASGSPKPNGHVSHVDARTTPTGEVQCDNCHASVTASNSAIDGSQTSDHANGAYNIIAGGTFRDGDNPGDSTAVTVSTTISGSPTVNTCSNVSCHPIGLDTVSGGPETRGTASVAWDNNYKCIDCHSMSMQANDTFHHAMRNYSSSYPTAAPNGDATSGTNPQNRRCTMCHVDHKIFSPSLNSSNTNGRAYNLRTDITVAPTTSTGYTNSDFVGTSGGSGGICISCHSSAKTKDLTRRRNDPGVTTTPVISFLNFSGSAHQFTVPGKMLSDGSTFQGDCSKCHNAQLNETSLFMNITTAAGSTGLSFGNHAGGIRRLQGALGAAGGETAEEQICYRCHHDAVADAGSSPGGGPPKARADFDYYGVKAMDQSTEGIYAIMIQNGFRTANTSLSSTNKLFFKPGATQTDYDGTVYPANPMPATPANDGDLGDTFAGGSYVVRSMSPWDPTTTYTTDIRSATSNQSGLRYWEMVKFVSPPAAALSGDLAGTWTINVYSRESSTSLNGRIRYMAYKWSGGGAGSKGATIIAKGTYATELSTTTAPGTNRQIAINVGSGTTLAVGEKIVVDLALETNEGTTSSSRVGYFYFGKGAPSNLTLPAAVSWTYGDAGTSGYGHNVAGYNGIHKPSPVDETRGFISANKHVECVDCHNPHALKSGLHTKGSATMATVLRGAFGVGVTTWGTTNWSGVTTYNPSTTTAPLITATAEWQVCFKCHSGANNNVTSWGGTGPLAWTDLALEFNSNNKSGHPVVASLSSYPNGRGAITNTYMQTGWTTTGTQRMTCSDCHGASSTTTMGPHGSTVKWMLSGPNKAWPFTLASQNGGSSGTTYKLGTIASGTDNGLFCMNCHKVSTTSNSRHNNATGGKHGWDNTARGACVSCHIRVPHGGKVQRLIRTNNTPSRYMPDGNGADVVGQSQQVFAAYDSGGFTSACGQQHSGGTDTW